MLRGVLFSVLLLALPNASSAQSHIPARSFDVASVRATDTRSAGATSVNCSNGVFEAQSVTLKMLIEWANDIDKDAQVTGGPTWIGNLDTSFRIRAKGDPMASDEICKQMVQTLLADRFRLVADWQVKDTPGYLLVVGNKGPKMRPIADEKRNGGRVIINGNPIRTKQSQVGMSMPQLAALLSGPASGLRSTVVDQTGLKGLYQFDLEFSSAQDDGRPDILTAVQEQLGLKLESRRIPLRVLSISRAEKPSSD